MNMQIKIENGVLRVDLYDYLRTITGEERAVLIDALACHDEVINEVANQLIDGWTSAGSHAGIGGASVETYHGIEAAWRRIATASGDIAAKEIKRLEVALESANALGQKGWDMYHELSRREA